jgi:hypothetical protein
MRAGSLLQKLTSEFNGTLKKTIHTPYTWLSKSEVFQQPVYQPEAHPSFTLNPLRPIPFIPDKADPVPGLAKSGVFMR